jgi:two-component system sensor histidine kinase DesK
MDMPSVGQPTPAAPAGGTDRGGPAAAAGARPPSGDQLDRAGLLWSRDRRLIIRLAVTVWALIPFLSDRLPGAAKIAFLCSASAVFVVVAGWLLTSPQPAASRMRWEWLVICAAVAAAILVVGGQNWAATLIITGAAIGANVPARWAVAGAAGCAAAGLSICLSRGTSLSNDLNVLIGPPLAAAITYLAVRRGELFDTLRDTRAELARMAVANERLRIGRDLHDLLGHSLSLITVKAELAGRLIDSNPDRAAREIAELQTVARRSLGEVRAAVTSYRQPSLAAELAEARQMLAAAGMDCRVAAPAAAELAPDVAELLAWIVREGATNAVRHSGARVVTITVTVAAGELIAEVADDGTGPVRSAERGAREQGSGLAGLAERARKAGAQFSAGAGPGGSGFRILVRVPADRPGGPGQR